MGAISRSRVKLWVQSAGTAASSLTTTAAATASTSPGYITGMIKSYSKSGGEKDVESDAVFGGFVDKEKPTTQVEVAFEIVPVLDSNGKANWWNEWTYAEDSSNTGVYTMADETSTVPSDRSVYIQADDGTNQQSWGFNNCNVTVLDLEHNADDNQTHNMTLKFSPTDDNGVSNFMTAATDVKSLPAWSALDNN